MHTCPERQVNYTTFPGRCIVKKQAKGRSDTDEKAGAANGRPPEYDNTVLPGRQHIAAPTAYPWHRSAMVMPPRKPSPLSPSAAHARQPRSPLSPLPRPHFLLSLNLRPSVPIPYHTEPSESLKLRWGRFWAVFRKMNRPPLYGLHHPFLFFCRTHSMPQHKGFHCFRINMNNHSISIGNYAVVILPHDQLICRTEHVSMAVLKDGILDRTRITRFSIGFLRFTSSHRFKHSGTDESPTVDINRKSADEFFITIAANVDRIAHTALSFPMIHLVSPFLEYTLLPLPVRKLGSFVLFNFFLLRCSRRNDPVKFRSRNVSHGIDNKQYIVNRSKICSWYPFKSWNIKSIMQINRYTSFRMAIFIF